MTWKVLRQFVNTLTADDGYSLPNRGFLTQHIQMILSQKERNFSQLFCEFFKYTLTFENFQKKMTLIAYVFPKLETQKDVVK